MLADFDAKYLQRSRPFFCRKVSCDTGGSNPPCSASQFSSLGILRSNDGIAPASGFIDSVSA
jgi:hypothetical protein